MSLNKEISEWVVYNSWIVTGVVETKKQKVVSRSSTEAEYRCMALTVGELQWLRALLTDFGVTHNGPIL